MKLTRRSHPTKSAHMLALLAILALLFSGLAAPPAQAAPESPQAPTIIAALSDYGSGETVEQTVATMIAGWNPARIVTAGDNYHYQNCNTYATCVGAYYGTYVTDQTFMPTMGNHDYDAAVGLTAWNNYFTWLPTNRDAQRRWYDFVVGDVHFFMLDGNGNQSTQSTWLSTAVPASTSTWNIAVIHQAPYSTGNYGDLTASQLPYGAYGIDFVISGHNHHFERLVKADGGKTVRYFIDGYGGSLPTGLGHSECGTNTTAATSEFCLANVPGAIKITASDTSITFEYYNSSGVLQHTYTQDANEECATDSLVATEDNYLSAANTDYNNGGSTELHVDATTGTSRRTSLLKWDVSSIPANAVVSSASLSLYVSDASPLVFNLYNLRRAWVEGTGNRTSSTTSSNWNTYDGANNWGTAGAANTSSDRYDANLWSAGTTSFSSTGGKTEVLNTEGIGVVQGWIDGTVANHGLIMQNYSGSTSNAVFFSSSENSTPANRPRLNVTYCVVAGPTITTSGTLTPFSTTPGTPSAAQTYTVSGKNLTADISITAPAGFEVATASGGPYSTGLTLTQSGGTVPATTIWVRLTGATEGSFSGDITHSSEGATPKNVAVSGTVGWCFDVSLVVAEDTHMRSGNTRSEFNYGGTPLVRVNPFYQQGSTDGQLTGALFKWLLTGVPTDATISAASLTFNVTQASNYAYGLYEMRRAWVEGTNNGATGTGASWDYYGAGTGSWGTAGAQNTTSDRYSTNLWDAVAADFNVTGSRTFPLNAAGLAIVQGWLDGSAPNYGLTMQNYSGTTVDVWEATSSEGTPEANRPKLTVTYCTPPPAALPKAPMVTSIALSGSNDVTLAWNAVTEDVNSNPTTITAYRVYYSHDPFFEPGGSDPFLTPTPTPTALTATHTGGSTGDTNWYYLVRAVNAQGESANSQRRTGRFGFLLVPGTAGN